MLTTIIGLILCARFLAWIINKLKIGNYGDRYVFITGCDTGFGNMLTKRLDNLGLHVFAGCLTESGQGEIRASCSDRVLPVPLDVTKDASIAWALDTVTRHLPQGKGLWALVNNAGIAGSFGPTSWQGRQDYMECMDVNLFGVIFVTNAFLPLVATEKGRVVIMSSAAGRIAAFPVYSISKFGVEAFGDTLRYENYSKGVSVHLIEPGYFAAPITSVSRCQALLTRKVKSLPVEIKETISDQKLHQAHDFFEEVARNASKDTYMVIDAMTNAITARFPKARYVVGYDARFIFRPIWMLPEWIADFIMVNFILKLKFD